MTPLGNMPVDPPVRRLPGGLDPERPDDHPHHQQVTDPKHGTNFNVLLSPNELNNDVPITVLTGNIGFQQPAASFPLLPPFARLRMSEMQRWAESTLVQEKYKTLVKELPSALQRALEENERLPKQERDPALSAFMESLLLSASLLAAIDALGSKEVEEDGENAGRELVAAWEGGLKEEGQTFLNVAKEYVAHFHGGAPERDALTLILQEVNDAMTVLTHQRNVNKEEV